MGGFGGRRTAALAGLVGVVATIAAGSAIGAERFAGASSAAGKSITAVRVVSEPGQFVTSSASYVDVTGATATVTVPASTAALVLIRLTASTHCDVTGGVACLVRAEINGVTADPGEVVLDSAPAVHSGTPTQAHAMDWSSGPLQPGSYTVQLQAAVSAASSGWFYLRTWHLTVERIKV
jgi:hypothetical protein